MIKEHVLSRYQVKLCAYEVYLSSYDIFSDQVCMLPEGGINFARLYLFNPAFNQKFLASIFRPCPELLTRSWINPPAAILISGQSEAKYRKKLFFTDFAQIDIYGTAMNADWHHTKIFHLRRILSELWRFLVQAKILITDQSTIAEPFLDR